MSTLTLMERYFDPKQLPKNLRNADRDLRHLWRFAAAKSFADFLWAEGGADGFFDLLAGGRPAFIRSATILYKDHNFTLSDFDWMWDEYLEPRAQRLMEAYKAEQERLKKPSNITVTTKEGIDGDATTARVEEELAPHMADIMEVVERGK
jgi:hypothetical protein